MKGIASARLGLGALIPPQTLTEYNKSTTESEAESIKRNWNKILCFSEDEK